METFARFQSKIYPSQNGEHFMKNSAFYYSVGALLYCPANRTSIADSIINEKFGDKFSLALCLEDTINDDFVMQAEEIMIQSLRKIFEGREKKTFFLPKIFIRVRNSQQISRLKKHLGYGMELITGFIIPKFGPDNADTYITEMIKANESSSKKIYMMPIYENTAVVDLRKRAENLYSLKDRLSRIEDLVLNIRVGGNDLCHIFGFRRHSNESIHQIKTISNIFSDIVTVYGTDYVISGPVWEYYAGDNWKEGLISELQDDRLCGFTGKTVIHPNQISLVNQAYQVSRKDFDDAQAILNWNHQNNSFVSGSPSKERMNEYKTHTNWAHKILYLAENFGIKDVH